MNFKVILLLDVSTRQLSSMIEKSSKQWVKASFCHSPPPLIFKTVFVTLLLSVKFFLQNSSVFSLF